MSDLNRGIMKFDGADSPAAIVVSAVLVLGGIGVLLWWAFHSAYTLG
jgi:type III secretory pathway component EscV